MKNWNVQGRAAFPVPNDAEVNGERGMSLRDYFAGQALAETAHPATTGDAERAAKQAYAIADAMLKEREK